MCVYIYTYIYSYIHMHILIQIFPGYLDVKYCNRKQIYWVFMMFCNRNCVYFYYQFAIYITFLISFVKYWSDQICQGGIVFNFSIYFSIFHFDNNFTHHWLFFIV